MKLSSLLLTCSLLTGCATTLQPEPPVEENDMCTVHKTFEGVSPRLYAQLERSYASLQQEVERLLSAQPRTITRTVTRMIETPVDRAPEGVLIVRDNDTYLRFDEFSVLCYEGKNECVRLEDVLSAYLKSKEQ